MKLLQKIFSIKNKDIHKVITVLGIKFKVKSNKLVIKHLKQEVKNLEDYITVQDNYAKVLTRLKEKIKTEPLNVIFLSNEPSKWSYDSLYREFEKSEHFNPKIIIIPLERIPINERTENLIEHYNFYKNIGCNVKYGYENDNYINLENFKPDIVFLPQPYISPKENMPLYISEYALTMYCPYGIQTFNSIYNYKQDFHKLLFTYFCETDLNIKRYENYKKGNSKNCVTVGYPKMDKFLDDTYIDISKYWKAPDKFKIIYAPHHSFNKHGTTNTGTFLENGQFILELAKKYSDVTTWIFKPHPRLKYILKEYNYMTQKEIDKYWAEWENIGNIYELGDYIDIFKSSDLMITDCASFLCEYLPSKKPLIRLMNKNCLLQNEFGEKIISEYYISHNNNELEQLINELVINKNDYKKEAREQLISEIIDINQTSANKIYNYIINLLKRNDNEV